VTPRGLRGDGGASPEDHLMGSEDERRRRADTALGHAVHATRGAQPRLAVGPADEPLGLRDGDCGGEFVRIDARLGIREAAIRQGQRHGRRHRPGEAVAANVGSEARKGAGEALGCDEGEADIGGRAGHRRDARVPGDGADHARAAGDVWTAYVEVSGDRANSVPELSAEGRRSGIEAAQDAEGVDRVVMRERHDDGLDGDLHVDAGGVEEGHLLGPPAKRRLQAVGGDSRGPHTRRRIRGKTSCAMPHGEMNIVTKFTPAAVVPAALAGAADGGGISSAAVPTRAVSEGC
jgi:hypothetical protein